MRSEQNVRLAVSSRSDYGCLKRAPVIWAQQGAEVLQGYVATVNSDVSVARDMLG
jgi:hypothetical protein